jgi:addiction module HigA family antidote
MAHLAIHPDEHLAEELNTLDMKRRGARAPAEGADQSRHRDLNGQRAVTGDTALRLGHFFGTSPQFWLNLQSLYGCFWPSSGKDHPSSAHAQAPEG